MPIPSIPFSFLPWQRPTRSWSRPTSAYANFWFSIVSSTPMVTSAYSRSKLFSRCASRLPIAAPLNSSAPIPPPAPMPNSSILGPPSGQAYAALPLCPIVPPPSLLSWLPATPTPPTDLSLLDSTWYMDTRASSLIMLKNDISKAEFCNSKIL